MRGTLVVLALLQALDVVPLHDVGLRLAAETLGGLRHRDPGQHPVAGAGLLHGDVEDGSLDAGAADAHPAVEHLADDQGLGGPLLEAPHVQQAGGDHLARVDVGHPGHRGEDLAAAEDLDDEADHARLLRTSRRSTTTTSRTLPTWSPCGSNTGSPASRAA